MGFKLIRNEFEINWENTELCACFPALNRSVRPFLFYFFSCFSHFGYFEWRPRKVLEPNVIRISHETNTPKWAKWNAFGYINAGLYGGAKGDHNIIKHVTKPTDSPKNWLYRFPTIVIRYSSSSKKKQKRRKKHWLTMPWWRKSIANTCIHHTHTQPPP